MKSACALPLLFIWTFLHQFTTVVHATCVAATSRKQQLTAQTLRPWKTRRAGSELLLLQSSALALPFARIPPRPWLWGTAAATVALTTTALTDEKTQRALYFWRFVAPIVVHYKFAQFYLERRFRHNVEKRHQVYEHLHNLYADDALKVIVNLRGLFVKVGQSLSSRPDMLPEQYVKRFATVQDALPPWPLEKVKAVMEQSLQSELNLHWEDVFESMQEEALGSASIGQVHAAVLKDRHRQQQNHRPVAVKVMHPGAHDQFAHDFTVFRWLCRVALPGWKGLLDELESRLMSEFDYRQEAENLRQVRSNMQRSPYRRKVVVPEPLEELCTQNVLVMELLSGTKLVESIENRIGRTLGSHKKAQEFLAARKRASVINSEKENGDDEAQTLLLEGTSLLQKWKLFWLRRSCQERLHLLVDVHGHQIFQDGAFNGDCHPGNALELDDGRLGLIDYGQTRRISDTDRLNSARVVLALDKGNATEIANTMTAAGFVPEDPSDEEMLGKYAALFFDDDSESKRLGFATPQLYFASLMAQNPLVHIPDSAIFIARASFLFRGLNSAIGGGSMRTVHRWKKHAKQALDDARAS